MPNADNNVTNIAPRNYYNILNERAVTLKHLMAGATDFDGALPATGSVVAANLDPVVTAGQALWGALTHGGLFPFQHPVIIEQLFSASCTATWTIVDSLGALVRTTPSVPFRLSGGERLKATSTGATGTPSVGVVARLDM